MPNFFGFFGMYSKKLIHLFVNAKAVLQYPWQELSRRKLLFLPRSEKFGSWFWNFYLSLFGSFVKKRRKWASGVLAASAFRFLIPGFSVNGIIDWFGFTNCFKFFSHLDLHLFYFSLEQTFYFLEVVFCWLLAFVSLYIFLFFSRVGVVIYCLSVAE